MDNPMAAEKPVDPRGGFQSSPEGCVNGTAWGGEIPLDGSEAENPYAAYESHTSSRPYRINPVA